MIEKNNVYYIDHGSFFADADMRSLFTVRPCDGMLCIVTDVSGRRIELLHPTRGFIYSDTDYMLRMFHSTSWTYPKTRADVISDL